MLIYQKKLSFHFLQFLSIHLSVFILLFLLLLIVLYQTPFFSLKGQEQRVEHAVVKTAHTIRITVIIPTPTPIQEVKRADSLASDAKAWGVAKKVGEHTWSIKVGDDAKIGSPQDIFNALNIYRTRNGRNIFIWDDKLAAYAQGRAETFARDGKLDSHAGFNDYINKEDGFHKLGFAGLGENSSYGYKLEGVHLIEWVYAADAPHNDNQLNSAWSHVGIGVSGDATDLVFGGSKM